MSVIKWFRALRGRTPQNEIRIPDCHDGGKIDRDLFFQELRPENGFYQLTTSTESIVNVYSPPLVNYVFGNFGETSIKCRYCGTQSSKSTGNCFQCGAPL